MVVVCSEDGIVWMGKVQKWEQQMMLVLAYALKRIRSKGRLWQSPMTYLWLNTALGASFDFSTVRSRSAGWMTIPK